MTINTTFTSGQILTAAQMNNLPWGVAGYVKRTTGNTIALTTVADVTGLTTTFTAVSGRLYEVSYSTQTRKSGGAGFIEFYITDGSNNVIYDFFNEHTTNEYLIVSWSGVLTGLSGSTTIKVRALTSTGSATIYGSAGNPSSLIVKDIGLA